MEQPHDGALDVLATSLEQFAGALLLHTFECTCAGAKYVAVDSLHELFLELLQLHLLLGPVPGAGGHVDRVDVLVVLGKRLDGLGGELECNLMLRHHVDVHDVGLDVDDLVVEDGLDERVGVLAQFRIGSFGDHDGAQGPDGVGAGQRLGQTSRVLLDAVERPLDADDALQRLGEPRLDL